MTFDEIDTLLKEELKAKFRKVTRRDYRKMERETPGSYIGYGKKDGVMFLLDIGSSFYLDIRLLEDKVLLHLRQDEETIIHITMSIQESPKPWKKCCVFSKDNLKYFFYLLDEYFNTIRTFDKKVHEFNHGKLDQDWVRNNRIEKIID